VYSVNNVKPQDKEKDDMMPIDTRLIEKVSREYRNELENSAAQFRLAQAIQAGQPDEERDGFLRSGLKVAVSALAIFVAHGLLNS
jgi:hypothetical protein